MRELFCRKEYGHSPGKEKYRCKRNEKRLDDELKKENWNEPTVTVRSWIDGDAAETSVEINKSQIKDIVTEYRNWIYIETTNFFSLHIGKNTAYISKFMKYIKSTDIYSNRTHVTAADRGRYFGGII